jgi:enoyl-CoA hydratase/carnithine racemase
MNRESRKSDYTTLLVERRDNGVLVVTLNRPDEGNAMNTQMCIDLLDLWTGLVRDAGTVRCVIVTGAGQGIGRAEALLFAREGASVVEQALWTMMECPVPVVVAVNGSAQGGGLEMVLAADFAYGVESARFGFPEVMIGIIPGVGGTTTLPRIVGERRAMEVVFTGDPFGAAEALEWGIFNRVCSAAELMPTAIASAGRIVANAPLAVRQAKKAIHEGLQMDVRAALRFEVEAYNRLVDTEDRLEGVLAWNERRTPLFKGR